MLNTYPSPTHRKRHEITSLPQRIQIPSQSAPPWFRVIGRNPDWNTKRTYALILILRIQHISEQHKVSKEQKVCHPADNRHDKCTPGISSVFQEPNRNSIFMLMPHPFRWQCDKCSYSRHRSVHRWHIQNAILRDIACFSSE